MKTELLRSTTLYGMTINDYYKAIEANQKTALVQQIGKIFVYYVSKQFVSGKAVEWEAQADFYNTYD